MLRDSGMFACVLIRRAVATKRHTTFLTGAQMNPTRADLEALFAFTALRVDVSGAKAGMHRLPDRQRDNDREFLPV